MQSVAAPRGLTAAELRVWIEQLHGQVDGVIVRVKGIVRTADEGLVLVQVVGRRCEVTPVLHSELQSESDLVVVALAD